MRLPPLSKPTTSRLYKRDRGTHLKLPRTNRHPVGKSVPAEVDKDTPELALGARNAGGLCFLQNSAPQHPAADFTKRSYKSIV